MLWKVWFVRILQENARSKSRFKGSKSLLSVYKRIKSILRVLNDYKYFISQSIKVMGPKKKNLKFLLLIHLFIVYTFKHQTCLDFWFTPRKIRIDCSVFKPTFLIRSLRGFCCGLMERWNKFTKKTCKLDWHFFYLLNLIDCDQLVRLYLWEWE
jgi:hypothetical protein